MMSIERLSGWLNNTAICDIKTNQNQQASKQTKEKNIFAQFSHQKTPSP